MPPLDLYDVGFVGAVGASGGGDVPETISDLYAWYDASDSTTFTFSSGTVVDKWINKEGTTDRDLIQATVSYQPSLNTTRNGLDTLNFANTSSSMYTYGGKLSNVSEPTTIVAVSKIPSNDSTQHFLWSEYDSAPTFEKSNSSNTFHFVYNSAATWTGGSAAVGNYCEFTCILNNGSSSMRFNNSQVATGGSTETFAPFAIGNHGGMRGSPNGGSLNTTTSWREEICEIIIYEKQLSSSELTEIFEYTEEKWDL